MPEISLLVQFLLYGLGDDINPISSSIVSARDRIVSSKHSSSPSEGEPVYPKCPMKALIGHILPAVAQLQVLTWRAQLAEEILATSHHLWPGHPTSGGPITSTATSTSNAGESSVSGPGATSRRSSASSLSDVRESAQPSTTMQKQITGTTVFSFRRTILHVSLKI